MSKTVIGLDINEVFRSTISHMKSVCVGGGIRFDDVINYDGRYDSLISKDDINKFNKIVYEDYPFEIFGSCHIQETMSTGLLIFLLNEMEKNDSVDFVILCPNENGLSIQATTFFLSKFSRVREILFPKSIEEIWKRCNVVITTNPKIIQSKPERKKVIKIVKKYNENLDSDFTAYNFKEIYTLLDGDIRDFAKDVLEYEFEDIFDSDTPYSVYLFDKKVSNPEICKNNDIDARRDGIIKCRVGKNKYIAIVLKSWATDDRFKSKVSRMRKNKGKIVSILKQECKGYFKRRKILRKIFKIEDNND